MFPSLFLYSKEHHLGKYAVCWCSKDRPWLGDQWNYFEPQPVTRFYGFRAECHWEVPSKKTMVRSGKSALEVTWEIRYYDDQDSQGNKRDLTFVAWQDAKFVEQGGEMRTFDRSKPADWIALYDTVYRLFKKAKPEPKERNISDWVLNHINTILNTIRLEMIFGQLIAPCRICEENFGDSDLCDECLPYAVLSTSE